MRYKINNIYNINSLYRYYNYYNVYFLYISKNISADTFINYISEK